MRYTGVIQVYDGDVGLAKLAVRSLGHFTSGWERRLVIVDDGSAEGAGDTLEATAKEAGFETHLVKLPRALKWEGTVYRVTRGLGEGLTRWGHDTDLYVKLDSDTLVTSPRFGEALREIRDAGHDLSGVVWPLPTASLKLAVATEALPMGFRRRLDERGVLTLSVGPRIGPLDFGDLARKSLRHPLRFHFVGGPVHILSPRFVRTLDERGLLPIEQDRMGAIYADDVLLPVLCRGLGLRTHDMKGLAEDSVPDGMPAEEVLQLARRHGWLFVHPLKDLDIMRAVFDGVSRAFQQHGP